MMKTMTTLAALIAMSTIALAKPAPTPKPTLSTTTVSCFTSTPSSITVQVQAGATGAPSGFSLQWMKTSDLQSLGGVWPENGFCKASFSGVPWCSNYNLAPYATITIEVGDVLFDACGASSQNCSQVPLDCDTQYSFRGFAHANSTYNRSAFSATTTCSTESCVSDGGCTYTQGFWATHGLIPVGNNQNLWPVTTLTLGSVSYTDLQLLSIFNTPARQWPANVGASVDRGQAEYRQWRRFNGYCTGDLGRRRVDWKLDSSPSRRRVSCARCHKHIGPGSYCLQRRRDWSRPLPIIRF